MVYLSGVICHIVFPIISHVFPFCVGIVVSNQSTQSLKPSAHTASSSSIRNRGEQDSSPTRQFTDTVFEDSSPTELKTVHRHF